MKTYALTHLSNQTLVRELDRIMAQERTATALGIAHIAEVDARRLYLPAGYPSMYEYCVRKLHLTEQAAVKRIRAGRTARRFPAIFHALADGRLHLSAVVLLTPHLTPDNADELMAAATHKSKAEIEQLLASRYPRPDVPTRLEAITPAPRLTSATESSDPATTGSVTAQLSPGTVGTLTSTDELATAQVEADASERVGAIVDPCASALVAASPAQLAPGPVEPPLPRPRMTPLSAERFAVQFTIARATQDRLRNVQALLSHRLPSGEIAQIFHMALELLERQLEKQKFAATSAPRSRPGRPSADARHTPAHVKRAWAGPTPKPGTRLSTSPAPCRSAPSPCLRGRAA